MKPKSKTPKAAVKREFYEEIWRRFTQSEFDAAWRKLSPAARELFLRRVEIPYSNDVYYRTAIPRAYLKPDLLAELVAGGFVEEFKAPYAYAKEPTGHAMAGAAREFALRMRSALEFSSTEVDEGERVVDLLRRMLGPTGYLKLAGVLRKGGLTEGQSPAILSRLLIRSKDWPDWVLADVGDKLADRIVAELEKAPAPIPPHELEAALAPATPEAVRGALGGLIGRFAVFESLDPATFELKVGLLPEVARPRRGGGAKAPRPKGAPVFEVVAAPADYAPRTGLLVSDLGEALLELSSQPVRIKQTGDYFVADLERIAKRFTPWPEWLSKATALDDAKRADLALDSAEILGLTTRRREDKRDLIVPSAEAARWLTLDHEARIDTLIDYPRPRTKVDFETFAALMASPVAVVDRKPNASIPRVDRYYVDRTFEKCDFAKLEESILAAFRRLPLGKYVRLDDVVDELAAIGNNPLTLGKPLDKIWLLINDMVMPPLPDAVELMTADLLRRLATIRLVPLDVLLAARSADGALLVARTPRLDRCFGKPSTETAAEFEGGPTKVLIQPDYSVVAIGLDPTPVLDLAPFCDRKAGAAGPGAATLKITKESVLRAATAGMTADQMNQRLRKHASAAVPDNVTRQIKDWAGWVRRVEVRPMVVVSCGGSDGADRVAAAIGSGCVRLGPAHVGLPTKSLTPEQRKKLAAKGVTVVDSAPAPAKASRTPRTSRAKSLAILDDYDDDLDFD